MDEQYREVKVEPYCFAVINKGYCVWDTDINTRNLEFLKGLDPSYFDYVARTNSEKLDTVDHTRAATAIRAAYHHGLETLFAQIFAILQAPACVAAWMQVYTTAQLRRLVAIVDDTGQDLPHTKLKVADSKLTWERISEALNRPKEPEDQVQKIQENFAWLWRRFARDFLKERFNYEYNSFKHGLRTESGGFSVGISVRGEDGKAPNSENMISTGGSEYGSNYLIARRLVQEGESKGGKFNSHKHTHFQLHEQKLNWDPEGLCTALALLSVSISNVTREARRLAGDDVSNLDFKIPGPDLRDLSLGRVEGVDAMDLNNNLQAKGLPSYNQSQILSVYERDSAKERKT